MNKFKDIMKKKGIEINQLGFGCWAIGGDMYLDGKYDGYGNINDDDSIESIQKAYELGINLFDTSDAYGTGHSEIVLGKAVKPFRNKVAIATKFGYTYNEKTKQLTGTNISSEYIKWAVKKSLTRLDTDYIDLYQLHVGGIKKDEILEFTAALDDLVKEGLILSYGWSTSSIEGSEIFATQTNGVAIQHTYNLFKGKDELIDICEKNELISLSNMPLAMGILSGKYNENSKITGNDVRNSGYSWVPYFQNGIPTKEYLDKINALREILTSNGRSLVQGALSWSLGRSNINIPIPGFKNVQQAIENAKTLDFGPLSKNQMDEIQQILTT